MIMRVYSAGAPAAAVVAAAPRRVGAGAFEVAESQSGRASALAAAPRALASLDALIALQSIDAPGERRRRIVKRGRKALDTLEELKLALLAGTLDGAALARLQALSGTLDEASGDQQLDGLMAEISLRAAVEIAKFSRP